MMLVLLACIPAPAVRAALLVGCMGSYLVILLMVMLVRCRSAPRDATENIERRTPNAQHRISNNAVCVRHSSFDIRH